ncbi:hypothetical protein [Halorubrum sp. AS12]|uniref:hypothetical protein n=1 Tax=Halorubrum sp. AS12 TaxID=3409687 RepID=UPI003DA71156
MEPGHVVREAVGELLLSGPLLFDIEREVGDLPSQLRDPPGEFDLGWAEIVSGVKVVRIELFRRLRLR